MTLFETSNNLLKSFLDLGLAATFDERHELDENPINKVMSLFDEPTSFFGIPGVSDALDGLRAYKGSYCVSGWLDNITIDDEGKLKNRESMRKNASQILANLSVPAPESNYLLQHDYCEPEDKLISIVINDLIQHGTDQQKLALIESVYSIESGYSAEDWDIQNFQNPYRKLVLQETASKVLKVFDYVIVRWSVALCITAVAIPILAIPFILPVCVIPMVDLQIFLNPLSSITMLFFVTVGTHAFIGAKFIVESSYLHLTGRCDDGDRKLQELKSYYKFIFAPIFYSRSVFKKALSLTSRAREIPGEMHQKRVEFLNKEANFEGLFVYSYRILSGLRISYFFDPTSTS